MSVSPAIRLFAAVTLAAAATIGGLAWLRSQNPSNGSVLQPSAPAAPFVLTDSDGARFDSARLKGKVALIFFGFTHCPDVCPTTLAAMTRVLEALGPEAADVMPVFISVDPARDTPDEMKAFGSLFDPRIVMLTGTPDEIAAVVRDYHIYAAKVALEGGGYTMDHTASVQLYDRESRFRSTFDFHEDDRVILEKVRLVLARGG